MKFISHLNAKQKHLGHKKGSTVQTSMFDQKLWYQEVTLPKLFSTP